MLSSFYEEPAYEEGEVDRRGQITLNVRFDFQGFQQNIADIKERQDQMETLFPFTQNPEDRSVMQGEWLIEVGPAIMGGQQQPFVRSILNGIPTYKVTESVSSELERQHLMLMKLDPMIRQIGWAQYPMRYDELGGMDGVAVTAGKKTVLNTGPYSFQEGDIVMLRYPKPTGDISCRFRMETVPMNRETLREQFVQFNALKAIADTDAFYDMMTMFTTLFATYQQLMLNKLANSDDNEISDQVKQAAAVVRDALSGKSPLDSKVEEELAEEAIILASKISDDEFRNNITVATPFITGLACGLGKSPSARTMFTKNMLPLSGALMMTLSSKIGGICTKGGAAGPREKFDVHAYPVSRSAIDQMMY